MVALRTDEHHRALAHAINNRLNTLAVGMAYLEAHVTQEDQTVIQSLRLELRDLQDLIDQLNYR